MSSNPFAGASCRVPGCSAPVVTRGRCAVHSRTADARRGLTSDRRHHHLYASARWRQVRRELLDAQPFCTCPECIAHPGRLANVVHHRTPHEGDEQRFFDVENLMPMAKACHDKLTGRSKPWGAPKRLQT